MTPSITDWIKALQGDDPAACAAATESLAAVGTEAVAALLPLLADARPAIRARAAAALGRIGTPAKESIRALFKLRKDSDGSVRERAAEALERIAPGCVAQHRHHRRRAAWFAVLVLVVLPGLVLIFNPFSLRGAIGGLFRGEAFFALRPTSYWAAELNGSHEQAREARTALRSGEMEARPVLEALATDAGQPAPVRAEAIRLLGALKREEVVPALTRLLLEDGDVRVRSTAAHALGGLGALAEPAIPKLYEALNGPADEEASGFREALADALAKIGGDHPVHGVFWQHRPAAEEVCRWKALAFSADGWMLLAHRDSEIHTWSVLGSPWNVFSRPDGVRQAILHPRGRWAVIRDRRGSVALWDLQTRDVLARFQDAPADNPPMKGEDGPFHLASSADGRYLALVGPQLRVYDLTRTPYQPLKDWDPLSGTPTFYQAVFAPDGSTMAVAAVAEVTEHSVTERKAAWWLFDVAGGKLRHHLPLACQAAAFSPDSKWFLTLGENSRSATVWDVSTGQQMKSIGDPHGDVLKALAVRCDNRTIALGGCCHHLSLWDATTGQKLRELNWHHYPVTALAFSPDGQKLASADERGWVKLWDAAQLALAPCEPGALPPIIPWR